MNSLNAFFSPVALLPVAWNHDTVLQVIKSRSYTTIKINLALNIDYLTARIRQSPNITENEPLNRSHNGSSRRVGSSGECWKQQLKQNWTGNQHKSFNK